MSEPAVRIGKPDLNRFASAMFIAAGVERTLAEEWANVQVWANLRGVDSHGVLRIPRYLDLLASGSINPKPDMRVERRSGAAVLLEADRAPGPVAMTRAMQEAIDRACEVHIGWCAARNITHAGAIGYFALQAAQVGMAGIVMTASGPLMAYHGARKPGVSTNPLAIAIPTKNRRPYVLDMSTSTVAMGKILSARDAGAPVPPGWGVDADGADTTDPHRIATLLPLGGAKGAGLSFMIECLCSVATANPLVAPALRRQGGAEGPVLNGVAIAVDLSAFGDLDQFTRDADSLGEAISALPRARGVDRILLPGERGDAVLAERERDGIPIPKGTWARLLAAATRLGVTAPS